MMRIPTIMNASSGIMNTDFRDPECSPERSEDQGLSSCLQSPGLLARSSFSGLWYWNRHRACGNGAKAGAFVAEAFASSGGNDPEESAEGPPDSFPPLWRFPQAPRPSVFGPGAGACVPIPAMASHEDVPGAAIRFGSELKFST